MSGYIGTQPVPQATQTRQTFTATASQTSFATGGYQAGYLDVFLNGVKLVDGTDYTATNGSDVVLTTGAASGDTLEVVAYTTFEAANVTGADGDFTVDGNLLVGQTTASSTDVGFFARPDGFGSFTRDGNRPLYLSRLTSDGEIVQFRKDGSAVGSIGSYAGNQTYITSLGGGMKFNWYSGTQAAIEPCSTSGAPSDDKHDLGGASARWQDLYLSGGVYLGGTGSANKLDDYEEGTWTSTLGGVTATVNTVSGSYTKIGDVVAINGSITISGKTAGSGNANFSLPFIPKDTDTTKFGLQITFNNMDTAFTFVAPYNGASTAFIYTSNQYAYTGAAVPNGVIKFNGSYQTT